MIKLFSQLSFIHPLLAIEFWPKVIKHFLTLRVCKGNAKRKFCTNGLETLESDYFNFRKFTSEILLWGTLSTNSPHYLLHIN